MQSKITHKEPEKKFEPFTLTIEVESVEELASLLGRFNGSPAEIKHQHTPGSPYRNFVRAKADYGFHKEWSDLDREAIRQGLYK